MGETENSEAVAEQAAADAVSAEEQADVVEEELDELGKTKQERDEYLELAQRARADFENYRKRAAKEAEEATLRGTAKLAAGVIPAVDDLERALEVVSADDAVGEGIKLVHRGLLEALDRAGVEAYDPKGEKFDPVWHEALQTRPDEDAGSGVVLETLEKGYRIGDQALRPARVVVSE